MAQHSERQCTRFIGDLLECRCHRHCTPHHMDCPQRFVLKLSLPSLRIGGLEKGRPTSTKSQERRLSGQEYPLPCPLQAVPPTRISGQYGYLPYLSQAPCSFLLLLSSLSFLVLIGHPVYCCCFTESTGIDDTGRVEEERERKKKQEERRRRETTR